MKKLNSLALCAILGPALALASGSVIAQESRTTAQQDQTQRQSPDDSRGTSSGTSSGTTQPNRGMSGDTTQPNRGMSGDTTQPNRGMSGDTTQPNRGMSGDTTQPNRSMSGDTTKTNLPGDRSQSQAATGQSTGQGTFLASKPARGFHADTLIGSNVTAQSGGDEVGTISDLIIDEDGQVVAVIVGVGGFLGMGEKNVAVEWDALQRTATSGGDEYEYKINATRDSLTKAPAYHK